MFFKKLLKSTFESEPILLSEIFEDISENIQTYLNKFRYIGIYTVKSNIILIPFEYVNSELGYIKAIIEYILEIIQLYEPRLKRIDVVTTNYLPHECKLTITVSAITVFSNSLWTSEIELYGNYWFNLKVSDLQKKS